MGLHGVKAVFFDLDNTLIDTAAAGRCAIEEVLPLSSFRRGARGHRGSRPGGGGAARVPLPPAADTQPRIAPGSAPRRPAAP